MLEKMMNKTAFIIFTYVKVFFPHLSLNVCWNNNFRLFYTFCGKYLLQTKCRWFRFTSPSEEVPWHNNCKNWTHGLSSTRHIFVSTHTVRPAPPVFFSSLLCGCQEQQSGCGKCQSQTLKSGVVKWQWITPNEEAVDAIQSVRVCELRLTVSKDPKSQVTSYCTGCRCCWFMWDLCVFHGQTHILNIPLWLFPLFC